MFINRDSFLLPLLLYFLLYIELKRFDSNPICPIYFLGEYLEGKDKNGLNKTNLNCPNIWWFQLDAQNISHKMDYKYKKPKNILVNGTLYRGGSELITKIFNVTNYNPQISQSGLWEVYLDCNDHNALTKMYKSNIPTQINYDVTTFQGFRLDYLNIYFAVCFVSSFLACGFLISIVTVLIQYLITPKKVEHKMKLDEYLVEKL